MSGPVTAHYPVIKSEVRAELARRLTRLLGERADFSSSARAAYAADSSNYRHPPLGVVFPRTADEVGTILEICADLDAPVTGQGTGTSLAGQATNTSVIVDTSRYLNAVLEIDPAARRARVEPGVILDHLQAALRPFGLAFGPDPATHAYCTIGGMVGNNSCGTHALYAGKTVDNVERLVVYLYGGERLELGAPDELERRAIRSGGGEPARVHGALAAIADRYGDAIRDRYPDIPRRVSGYNLDELLAERGFHPARALVGSESTCALTTEITVRLIESPPVRRLVVLGFPDIYLAADFVPELLDRGLLGLEGFDETLVTHIRAARLNIEHLALLPEGRGWLIAEVGGAQAEDADEAAASLLSSLPGEIAAIAYADPAQQRGVWSIRESGLGATAHPPGHTPNHEGWEDTAVAPAVLGQYLRGIAQLWDRYDYHGAWYGHFGQGCVHTRNNFDFSSAASLARYRAYIEDAARLCVSLGGSLSGEHGDGQARSELLGLMFGDELLGAFAEFKAVFDPRGKMNPGVIVGPRPLDEDLQLGPDRRRVSLGPLYFSYPEDEDSLQVAVERCVGVGRCRRDDTAVMCPSFRATRDEIQTTRGRAKLLGEMFRGELTAQSWVNDDVFSALELCLSCKGCASDCPTHVDIATYKSEFLAHYYQQCRHPRADWALGYLPRALRAARRMPGLVNALLGEHRLGRTLRAAAGMTTIRAMPRLAARFYSRTAQAAEHRGTTSPSVVLFVDTFSECYLPERAAAVLEVLEAAGERVHLAPAGTCCARPLFDLGMLDRARATLTATLDALEPQLAAMTPVVVPEPSCLAVFRDELPRLCATDWRAERLASLARSLPEHLVATSWSPRRRASGRRAVVHPHCHGRSIGTPTADKAVLEAAGYAVEMLDLGCCGLAGGFGFRATTAPVAITIAEDRFVPGIARLEEDAILVIDGFSCEIQASQLAGRGGVALAELLRREHL